MEVILGNNKQLTLPEEVITALRVAALITPATEQEKRAVELRGD